MQYMSKILWVAISQCDILKDTRLGKEWTLVARCHNSSVKDEATKSEPRAIYSIGATPSIRGIVPNTKKKPTLTNDGVTITTLPIDVTSNEYDEGGSLWDAGDHGVSCK